MTMIRRLPGRPRRGFAQRAVGVLGVLSICTGAMLGLGVAASSATVVVNGFSSEGANTYTTESGLSPQCPNALAGTPGSDPAAKVLNNALNTPSSFEPNGTVHYIYNDNPNTDSEDFNLQDCVVVYPTGYFTAADMDPVTGVVINTSKNQLDKSGTQVDGATLSGVLASSGQITYSWTAPTALTPGNWVCNFARDISNGHGGSGNRKVNPTCYEVKAPVTPTAPTQTASQECGVQDTYTIPATTGVTYKINGLSKAAGTYPLAHGATVDITAVANDGYYFPADTTTTWSFLGGVVESCNERPTPVTPTAATHTTTCGVADTYTIPSTTGVLYQVGGVTQAAGVYPLPAGTSVTITAIADDGYVLVDDVTTSWGPFTGAAVVPCGGGNPGGGTTQIVPTTTTTVPPTTTTTTEAPTTTAAPDLALTPEVEPLVITEAPAKAPELPLTGNRTTSQALLAVGLLGFGSLLVAASRRRKPVPQRLKD